MTAAESALDVFHQALSNIQRMARRDELFWPPQRNGRGLRLDDLLGLRLAFRPEKGNALFDHRVYDRIFELYAPLTRAYGDYWQAAALAAADRVAMSELFLLHELLHVGQGAHSDVYDIDGQSRVDLFDGVDYAADAQALRMAFDMNAAGCDAPARRTLWIQLMGAQLHGGFVFRALDGGAPLSANAPVPRSIAGARLRRQSVWALQYARALAYLPESDGWGEALGERIEWQWLSPTQRQPYAGHDLCDRRTVSATAMNSPLRGHFTVGGRLVVRHDWTHPRETEALASMLFDGDFSCWNAAYRRLFDSHPFLTGRGSPNDREPLRPPHPAVSRGTALPGAATRHITIDVRGATIVGTVYEENNFDRNSDDSPRR